MRLFMQNSIHHKKPSSTPIKMTDCLFNKVFAPRRIVRGSLLLLPLIFAVPVSATECGPGAANRSALWSDEAARAIPEKVVPPTYPPRLLEQGISGTVEASLRIGRAGSVSEVLTIKAESGGGAFEKAVLEVIRHWRFVAETGCDCKPVESTVRLTVWFEIKEGQPSISVSRAAIEEKGDKRSEPTFMITGLKRALNAFGNSYPRSARRAGEEGTVYGIITIDSATAIAQGIEVTHVEANPDFRRTFSSAAASVVPGLKFGFDGVPTESPVKACFSIRYMLQR